MHFPDITGTGTLLVPPRRGAYAARAHARGGQQIATTAARGAAHGHTQGSSHDSTRQHGAGARPRCWVRRIADRQPPRARPGRVGCAPGAAVPPAATSESQAAIIAVATRDAVSCAVAPLR